MSLCSLINVIFCLLCRLRFCYKNMSTVLGLISRSRPHLVQLRTKAKFYDPGRYTKPYGVGLELLFTLGLYV